MLGVYNCCPLLATMYIRVVSYLVCSEPQCIHIQLSPSALDIVHVRKVTRPSTFFVQPKMAPAWEQGYWLIARR